MNTETVKIIWIYLNNYDFTITKISNVFCGFVFFSFEIFAVQLKLTLWFYNLMKGYFRRPLHRYFFRIRYFYKKKLFLKTFFTFLTDNYNHEMTRKSLCGLKWHWVTSLFNFVTYFVIHGEKFKFLFPTFYMWLNE